MSFWHLLQVEPHQGLQRFVRDLNALYRSERSLYEVDFDHQGFEWVDFHDVEGSIISFIRRGKRTEGFRVFVCNFTPVPRNNYHVGVPALGFKRAILNSDSSRYWGSNVGNGEGVHAVKAPFHGRPFSLKITLPPLSVVVFKPVTQG